MALTYEQALAEAKRQQATAGAKGAIDPNYVKTLMGGQDAGYTQSIINTAKPAATGVISPEKTSSTDFQSQLVEAQKQKQLSALEQAYKKNIGMLGAEKEAVDPLYAGQTRQAVAMSTMGKKSFSDFLAEKGLSSSGLAGQGEISQNIAMQSQLGGIESQRSNALADIERRRTGYGEDLAYGRQQAQTGADITALEQQLRQAEQQRALDLQAQEQAKESQLQTLGQYSNDFQAEINRRRATADTSDDWLIPYLAAARQDKIGQLGLDQSGRPISQVSAQPTITATTALNLWKSLGVANESIAKALGIPVGTRYTAPTKSTSGGTTKTATFP